MKELMLIIPVLLWPLGLDISLPWLNKHKRRLVEEYNFLNQDIPLQELKANFWIVAPHGYLSSLRVPWEMGPEANCPLWYFYSTLTSPPFPLSLHLIFLFKYGYLILLSKFTCSSIKAVRCCVQKISSETLWTGFDKVFTANFPSTIFFFSFNYISTVLQLFIRSLFH